MARGALQLSADIRFPDDLHPSNRQLAVKRMRNKVYAGIALLIWTISILAAGFYGAFYMAYGLEMNDRLKYEVAYLRGYVAVQKKLKEAQFSSAEKDVDFLIDAHSKTLSEFRTTATDGLRAQIDEALCRAIELRKEYPAVRNQELDVVRQWYEDLERELKDLGNSCDDVY